MITAHNNQIKKEAVCSYYYGRYVSHMNKCAAFSLLLLLLSGCTGEKPDFDDFNRSMSKADILNSFGEPDLIGYFYALTTGEYIRSSEIQDLVNVNYSNEVWLYSGKRTFTVTDDREYAKYGQIRVVFDIDGNDSDIMVGKGWTDEDRLLEWASDNDT